MKSFYAFFVAAAVAIPTMVMGAPTINGTLDAQYGSALATQQLATTALDNTLGLVGPANGSELDAAYGFISNGVLYLFFAGNIDSGDTNASAASQYDKLHIFFQTGPGGQNILTNGGNYGGADFGRLNNMAGMTFDSGFAPNFWMNCTAGGTGTNPTFYANFARMSTTNPPDAGLGTFLGQSSPPNYIALTNTTIAGSSVSNPVIAAFNNSNTAGVLGDPAGCQSNGAPFSPQSVTTGVELAIPVSAIGASTGNVKICAFFTSDPFTNVYNQVLGTISGNSSFCQPSLGHVTNVNFGSLPGTHSFTVIPPPCTFGINPVSTNFDINGGTGSFSIIVAGFCSWSLTSNVPWVTITSSTNGTGPATVNYTVSTNSTPVGRQATITLNNPPSPPLTFTLNQFGPSLPVSINGAVETNRYGCAPLTYQLIGTGYGDSTLASADFANGSELDAAYAVIENGILYIVIAGNLESNDNKLNLFFETGPGGQNTLATNYFNGVDSGNLNRMGPDGNGATNGTPGLTFDADFAPTYWMSVGCGGAIFSAYANYLELVPGGSNGYFLGRTAASTNGTLFGGTNPYGIQMTINNTNILGVLGDGCFDDPGTYAQQTVMTGVELGIPLIALGNPTGRIKICAFITSPSYDNVSNQVLGPPWDGTGLYCLPNLGEPSTVNFSTLPNAAGPHYFVAGPEMRVTGISRSGNNINVTWLSAANSNLVYQLQRTSTLNTSVWVNVGSPTNGTGLAIAQTDSGVVTSSNLFYRVKQTPVCP